MFFYERREVHGADLLLAFEQQDDVHGQLAFFREGFLDPEDVG